LGFNGTLMVRLFLALIKGWLLWEGLFPTAVSKRDGWLIAGRERVSSNI